MYMFLIIAYLLLNQGFCIMNKCCPTYLGPVVQSIVRVTSSLRGQLVKCFTTSFPNTLIYFVEKMREAIARKSFSHFFNKKYWPILDIKF